jgi:hypothetical protein
VKKSVLTMAVLALGGIMSTQASAAPLSSAAGIAKSAPSSIEHVADRSRNGMNDRRERHYNDWRRDRRYYRYRSWNRYNARPYNYRSRGCVSVGALWFCQ